MSEKDIKDSILKAGGVNNASGVFLQQNCQEATQVASKTGVNQRSVSIIPQSSIAPDLLKWIKKVPITLLVFVKVAELTIDLHIDKCCMFLFQYVLLKYILVPKKMTGKTTN